MGFHRARYLVLFSSFSLYINNFCKSTDIFDFHIFADDTNLFYSHKSQLALESEINNNLYHISNWLAANKLSLNIEKTNFIIFHPHQKKTNYPIKLYINDKSIKREMCIKYLGIFIDTHLNWKSQILHISKKIKRCVGTLSKLRYYVNTATLIMLYYSLIYSFPIIVQ